MADKRTKIGDIADALGLSTSTVSRALSGSGYVSDTSRRRVLETARKLGYVPDVNARNLRSGRQRSIGFLVSNLDDPFYAQLATGFEAVARQRGYTVMLALDQGDEDDELQAVTTLVSMGVTGVALTPVSSKPVDLMVKHGLAVVQLDRTVTREVSSVSGDNEEGGWLATSHLLEHGHSRIAIVLDHDRWTTGRDRVAGYRRAHADLGVPLDDALIMHIGENPQTIQENLDRFFANRERRGITAVFAANSVVARCLYEYCLEHDIRIPSEFSLVGYDDLAWTSLVRPAVTVVSQHVDELGRMGAESLHTLLAPDRQERRPAMVRIQPTLEVRGTVACRD